MGAWLLAGLKLPVLFNGSPVGAEVPHPPGMVWGLPQRESAGYIQKRTGYLGYKQLGGDAGLHCECILRGHT